MSCVTGETAGKSIAIDALGLCLGERAFIDAGMLRHDWIRPKQIARLISKNNPNAQQWLATNELRHAR